MFDEIRAVPKIWSSPAAHGGRLETLKIIFAEGFGDFNLLLKAAKRSRKIAGWWVKFFFRHPGAGGLAEMFFLWIYFPLLKLKSGK